MKLGNIFYLLLVAGIVFPVVGRSDSTQDSLKIDDVTSEFEIDAIEVDGTSEEGVGSFLGKGVDRGVENHEIQVQQIQNVNDFVDQVVGLENLGGPRQESQGVSIRGFQPKQVLMLYDGARSNFSMTHNSVTPIRPHLLKRVDVVKGGASSRFGNGALGGAVSFSTMNSKDLVSKMGPGRNSVAELRSSVSTANASSQQSATLGQVFGSRKKSGFIVDYTQTHRKDIRLSTGDALPFSASKDNSIWAKAHHNSGKNYFWVSGEKFEKDSVTPFNPTVDQRAPRDIADQLESSKGFRAQYKRTGGGTFRPEVLVYQTETEMERGRVDDGRIDLRKVETTGLSFHLMIEPRLSSQKFRWNVQPGFEVVRDLQTGSREYFGDNPSKGELPSFPNGHAVHSGAYVLSDMAFGEKVWLQSGIRFDHVNQRADEKDFGRRTHKEWSPEMTLGLQATEELGFSVGYEEGFNAPKIQDMFVDGLHFSDGFSNNFFIPNLELVPEKSKTVEGKMTYEYGSRDQQGEIQVSVFRSWVDHYIDQEIKFFEETTQFVDRGSIQFDGREVAVEQELGPIELRAGYSQVRSLKANGQPLSKTPADQLKTSAIITQGQWYWGLENQTYYPQNRVDLTSLQNVDTTPGFTLQNALVGYGFKGKSFAGVTRLKVSNVLDREYKKHGTPLEGTGRNVQLQMVIGL